MRQGLIHSVARLEKIVFAFVIVIAISPSIFADDVASEGHEALIGALQRGDDVSGPIHALRAERQQGSADPAYASRFDAVQPRLERTIRAIERRLGSAGPGDLGERRLLDELIQSLRAELLLADALLDQQLHRLDQGVPGSSAQSRLRALRNDFLSRTERLRQSLEATQTQLEGGQEADLATLRNVLRGHLREPSYRILGASTPLHQTQFPQRAPDLSNTFVPAYLDSNATTQPVDSQPSDDAPWSPAILAKAEELGYDYAKIFDFVRQNIRTEWYAGQMRSPDLTLQTLAGNDVDQAVLLVALLRASGAAARYVHGTIEIEIDRLSTMLGEDGPLAISRALNRAGIANEAIVSGGQVSAFRLEHTWVAAYVPFANYRGSVLDRTGHAWTPLAPAIKAHRWPVNNVDTTELLADLDALEQAYFTAESLTNELPLPAAQMLQRAESLDPTLDPFALRSRGQVDTPVLSILPASLPFAVVSVFAESAFLDDDFRQWVSVRIFDDAGDVLLDEVLPAAALVERRVTLSYQPASSDDHDLILANGGMALTPPAVLQMRPVIHVDGRPYRVAERAMGMAREHEIEIVLSGPGGVAEFRQTVLSGGMSALHFTTGDQLQANNLSFDAGLGDSQTPAASYLGGLARYYARRWAQSDDRLASLLGARLRYPLPGLIMLNLEMHSETLFGLSQSLLLKGVSLDAGLRPVDVGGVDATTRQAWFRLAGLQGSLLEHQVFEDQWGTQAVSADQVLALADSLSIPIIQTSQVNELPELPDDIQQAIERRLSLGYEVQVPAQPVTVGEWTGIAWVVREPSTGESGFFLSGHYAGGATTEPPADWILDFLADALRFPYDEPPNTDSSSVARLRKLPTSDLQWVEAGQAAATPLTILATDRFGRPVEGAEITFQRIGGNGQFQASGATAWVDQVTVFSNRLGLAQARYRPPTRVLESDQMQLIHRSPEDQYPTWIGRNLVRVVAATGANPVVLPEPFTIFLAPTEATGILVGTVGETAAPLSIQGPINLRVLDEFGNSVSNVPVQAEVGDVTSQCSFDASGALPSQILADEESCDIHMITAGNWPEACLGESLEMVSSESGVYFHLLTSNVHFGETPIQITLDSGIEGTYTHYSGGHDLPCGNINRTYVVPRVMSRQAVGPSGRVIEAYRPGTLQTQSRKVWARLSLYSPSSGLWDFGCAFTTCGQEGRLETSFNVSGGGQITEVIESTPEWDGLVYEFARSYELQLRPGLQPAEHELGMTVIADWGSDEPLTLDFSLGQYYTVDGFMEINGPVLLNDQGRLQGDLPFRAHILPESYWPGLYFYGVVSADYTGTGAVSGSNWEWQQWVSDAGLSELPDHPLRDNPYEHRLSTGTTISPDDRDHLAVTLSPGSPWELVIGPQPIEPSQRIISGFDAHALREGLVLPEVLGRFPRHMTLTNDIDVANQLTCEQGGLLRFELNHAAELSLDFYHMDEAGNATTLAWSALESEDMAAGLHSINVPMSRLRFGDFQYQLRAVSQVYDGGEEAFIGTLSHVPNRRDQLPLAHALVKGVNVFDGSLSVAREDVALAGRGPGLRFVRSYSPHRALTDGPLGFGWTHNYAASLRITPCGEHIISGADGQSMTFISLGMEDGVELFEPALGYHGTLRRLENNEFEFFSKDGTRYAFSPEPVFGHHLTQIDDPNGNTVTLSHQIVADEQILTSVTDDSGRQLLFDYETRTFTLDDRQTVTRSVIVSILGPEDLLIEFDYDAQGNLIETSRQIPGVPGDMDEHYVYQDYDQVLNWPGERPSGNFAFGYRLVSIVDEINGARRDYEYVFDWDYLSTGDALYAFPRQRVAQVREPDGGETDFSYTGERGTGPVSTTVIDARGAGTSYQLNRYGAAVEIAGPIGTELIEWNLEVMQPAWREDANGTRREFDYDDHGNRINETLIHAAGTQQRNLLFYAPEAFDRPIKNRVAIATDYRGTATDFSYDNRGNRLSQTRGGVTESFSYNARGDRVSETDGTGAVRHFGHDSYGYIRSVSDAVGMVQEQSWDALGRRTQLTDGEGYTIIFSYDSRDRVTQVRHPNGEVATTTFADASNTRIETNPRGIATTFVHDDMGRLLEVSDALGVIRAMSYDPNGNVLTETDGNGHTTTHSYDAESRRTGTQAPEGRTTTYSYDALGLLIAESTGNRTTTYSYDHPLDLQTESRRMHPDGVDALTQTDFDANGNRTAQIDPNGQITTWIFDARDRLTQETAPAGRVTTLAYDAADRRTRETLNTTPPQVREWTYDVRGREIAYLDASGGLSFQIYDRRDRVLETMDPLGHSVFYDYDDRGRLTRETGPEPDQWTEYMLDGQGNRTETRRANGQIVQSDYDIRDRLVLQSDQIGLIRGMDYDGNDNVLWEDDANGHRTMHQYDELNRRVQTDHPENRTERWTYNVHDEVTSHTNPRELTTAHQYNGLGQQTQTTLADGSLIIRRFDPVGNLTEETNARGFTTTYAYDGLHRRTSQTDDASVGTSQTWTYDSASNVLTHTDRRGIATRTSYDGENRPLEIRRAGLLQIENRYDAADRLVRETDANGHVTEYRYDRAGRRTESTVAGLATTRWTYSSVGDVLTLTDPDGLTTGQTWDIRQRMLSRTNAADETTTYEYDGVGNLILKTRPSGAIWTSRYDSANRLVEVVDPLGNETSYAYDANDNLTSQTNARGHSTTFTYGVLDHLTTRTYPDAVSDTFVHDAHGNRTSHTDANGQARTYIYDALNRQTEANYPAATGSESIQVSYLYDGNGNRVQVTEQIAAGGTQTSTYRYDPLERLDQETDRFGQTTTHAYDPNGNRIQRTDATGTTLYQYDDLDRLIGLTAPNRGAVIYQYSPAGRVTQIEHPDGTRTDQGYDAAGRLNQISHFRNGERQAHYAYTFDDNGNRVTQVEDLGAGEVTTSYVYDNADRLVRTDRDGRVTDYVLDAVGNRTEENTTTAATSTTKTLSYNNRNQLQTIHQDGVLQGEYLYDANGNRVQATTAGIVKIYTFSARDRLLNLSTQGGPPDVEWAYDDAGFRISETTQTEARRFRWDGEQLSYETNILGNLLARYDHGPDRLLAETETNQTRTWLIDGLRTPVKRLNDDGTTYSQTVYDEYGMVDQELSPDTPRFGFTGHQRGPASDPDLYYAQQRYYNAATGRFISEDPLWGMPDEPLSLHRYLYAYANPTVYIDPDGRAVVLSQIRDFLAQRRQGATDASIQLRESDFANRGVVSDLTTRTGAILTAVGGGIFGLGEAGFGVLNTGANLVGSATGLISDKSIGELDDTFRTAEAVVSGAQQFGRTLFENPVETGRRGASAVGQFGYDAFIAGDPRAQANLGVALPGLVGGSGAVRVSAQNLRRAGDSVRQAQARFAERIARGREADALVTASEARSLRVISETPDGGALDPQFAIERMLRSSAAQGDMDAVHQLVAQGKVDGLRLNRAGRMIETATGHFISHQGAIDRASQRLGTIDSHPIELALLADNRRMRDQIVRMNEAKTLREDIGQFIKTTIEIVGKFLDD